MYVADFQCPKQTHNDSAILRMNMNRSFGIIKVTICQDSFQANISDGTISSDRVKLPFRLNFSSVLGVMWNGRMQGANDRWK